MRRRYPFAYRLALLSALAAWAIFLVLSTAPNPEACPGSATYENSSLVEDCETSDGRVVCVISALGFSPTRVDNPDSADVYSPRGVPDEGPWCRGNSRRFGATP